MHESTNAVRLELNKLSKAGFLVSFDEGNTIQYRANEKHPLFPELKSLVRKYLGLDKVVENIKPLTEEAAKSWYLDHPCQF